MFTAVCTPIADHLVALERACVRDRFEFLSAPMDPWTMDETVGEIARRIEAGELTQHVVVNVAKLVNMRKNPELRDAVVHCNIINIDGMGVVWGARWMGHVVPERVAGVDLFHALLAMATRKGYPVFLLGATPEVVERTVQVVSARYPGLKLAGYHHGYFWEDEESVVEMIGRSGARLLFVAITSPKKEQFIDRCNERLGVNFVMGVGGAFDILAGKTRRAPLCIQNTGLEWLYRVIQEPRRTWRRYLVTNSVYAWLLLKAKFKPPVKSGNRP